MKRRQFIQTVAAGTTAAAIPLVSGCVGRKNEPSGAADAVTTIPEYSVSQIQALYKSGELTPSKLLSSYISRIKEIDFSGPTLKSVIEINPDAEELTKLLDQELQQGKLRGPLHGIPVLIKDNIDTADQMHTTAGSLALKDSVAPADAFIVKKLRDAGAVVLGKTNMSEWANFRSSRSSSGWSGRGGQTRNPYVLNRNPCGSSSGSAVAVAANLCAIALGTETDGSVVCPSSVNGIAGLKPTVGLWSRTGIIPISKTQDTAGPMARSVTDAAVLLGILAGNDPSDPYTALCPFAAGTDFTQTLNPDGLNGARIGVARDLFGFHSEVDRIMEESLKVIKSLGAEVIDPANLNIPGEMGDLEMEVLLYEFKDGLNRYLAGLPAHIQTRTLEDIIAFNEDHKNDEMPWFGQEIFQDAQKKGDLSDRKYLDALKKTRSMAGEKGIDRTIRQYNLHAIIGPTAAPAWTTDLVNGDHYMGGSSSPAACAGYPAITIPAGYVHGLPVGITFMGQAWSEPVLLKLAFAFEYAVKARKAPGFIPELPAVF
jgi:amidase